MPRITASPALSRFRVLDLTRARSGPTCVRMLADFGADVIKIEEPPSPDAGDPMVGGDRSSSDFQNLNRNKRSLTLNLKKPEGRAVLLQLVRAADVVVENWRPDVKKRLGLDYEALCAVNPRIILASISGFGQDGPYAGRPGFDQVIQGMSGLMSVTGFPGQGPVRAGLAVADLSAGLFAAYGIVAALLERETSGKGQWVSTSLLQAQIAMMDFQAVRFLNEGDIPTQVGNDHPTASPMGAYAAADGVQNIAISGQPMWEKFCEIVDRKAWIVEPDFATEKLRLANRPRLSRELNALFATQPVAYWVELLNRAGVPCGPVYTIPAVFDDPQVRHLGVSRDVGAAPGMTMQLLAQPVTLERTPPAISTLAPGCGEHTDEVLREAGYDDASIRGLRAGGVI